MITKYESTSIYAEGYLRQDNRPTSTETIEKYCRNLNKEAALDRLSPIIGRGWEISRMANILSKRKGSNPLLIGEAGVGKTAMVEALAQRIVSGKAPKCLEKKVIYELSLSSLNAGTQLRGSVEERIEGLIKELQMSDNIILFIDEVHTVIGLGTGSQQVMDLANMLKPAMADGTISVIGATTMDEFNEYIKKDKALTRRFANVIIEEPSDEETMEILNGAKDYFENFHTVLYGEPVLKRIMLIAKEYNKEERLPASAISLMDEIGAFAKNSPKRWTKGGNSITIADAYYATSSVLRIEAENIKKRVEGIIRKDKKNEKITIPHGS